MTRRRSLVLASLAVLLAVGGGVAFLTSRSGGGSDRPRSTPTPAVRATDSADSATAGTGTNASALPASGVPSAGGAAVAEGGSKAGAPPPAGGAAAANPATPKSPASTRARGPGDPRWDRSGLMAAPE